MLRLGAALTMAALQLVIAACGKAPAGFPDQTAPTPISQPFSVDIEPRAVIGGTGATGTITLSAPAPTGGQQVSLSSSHQAVVVPQTVVVPAGAFAADFTLVTQSVPADTEVSVQASAAGRSVTGIVTLWSVLPQFFSWTSGPTTLPPSQIGRLTDANAVFTATCDESSVRVDVRDQTRNWAVIMGAPAGQPLRAGVYENASSNAHTAPRLDVGVGLNVFCSTTTTGRFTVHDIDVTRTGNVLRFRASFETRCGGTTLVRGDVRVANAPQPDPSAECTR